MTQVCVLGAGSWGTALAKVLADKKYPTTLWTHRQEQADAINAEHVNQRYLPMGELPANLRATGSFADALAGAELVVSVVPSHATRGVLGEAKAHIPKDAIVCSASKGIENDTLMLMSEVFLDVLGKDLEPRMTYLSGPSFAKETALGMPTAVVIAGSDDATTEKVQRWFATERFRTYASHDVVGVEVGGALKNVVAIAAGVVDGLGFGHNSRAALITRGLAEIGRVAVKMGANPMTLAGLSGMGDLVLTCTGDLSRNRTVGFELGKGRTLADILANLGHVAEGVKTTKSAYDLSVRMKVEMPITAEIYKVLYEDKSPRQAVVDLMGRDLKRELPATG